MSDPYLEALGQLYGRLNYERVGMPRTPSELRLERMRRLMRALGDPHATLRIFHVAGTKGKGSTSALIAAALRGAGLRTGLFTSPHLHRLEERFVVDGRPIVEPDFVSLFERVRPAVEAMDAQAARAGYRSLTFFEVTTAMGLLHFAERGVDACVVEVGLGGRLDSTNVLRPCVSVITSISFDHTKILGDSLTQIAREKAGILKRGVPAVVGTRGEEPRAAIAEVARLRRIEPRWIDRDFSVAHEAPVPPLSQPTPGRVRVRTWRREWPWIELPLLGAHQSQNAATAIAALEAWSEVEPRLAIDPGQVGPSWGSLQLPARVEVAGRSPWLVIDGAHNSASAAALVETLAHHFPRCPRTLIFGTSRDKDLGAQLDHLLPVFDAVITTRYVENPRGTPPETIAVEVNARTSREARIAPTPAEALQLAREITPKTGLICVTGSLFLAAEMRSIVLGLAPAPLPINAT